MTKSRWFNGFAAGWCVVVFSAAQTPRSWEDPAVFEEGQEPAHATLMPFASRGQALRLARKESPYCLLLNGDWRFHWAAVPEEAPAEFFRSAFDDSRWDLIQVPGNWQMQGYDWPKFRNIAHPFKSDPPHPPAEFNPVGSYRRSFEIPAEWQGRQVFLHFEGVKSASEVWVNGRRAGYNQGGMEPAEYNITGMLQPGLNSLAVRVFRNSDGTYLEDQDMWRLSGIYRDVYLMATPEVHIRDFAVITDLDSDYRDAELRVEMAVRNYGSRPFGGQVRVGLAWGGVLEVAQDPMPVSVAGGAEAAVSYRRPVAQPRQWSAEKPNLYVLVLELLDAQGNVTEILSTRVGFRKVEIRDQEVLVNGVPTKFNGVNSHMHHPVTGNQVDTATLRRDLVLMKQFNINLVRTSHYPPPPEYLELADELGMYIIDEVGDEAHATEFISEDPAWREAYLDRARKMVLRDRNHPSIVIWSAGNESGSGDNICAVIEEGKRLDPTRPGWMYGGNNDYLGDDPNAFRPTRCEDIVGPRYPTPRTLEEVVARVPAAEDPRPSFMDEYLAASGNALGALDEFWELIRRYPRLTGGAVWDWMSPGISWPVRLTPNLGLAGRVLGTTAEQAPNGRLHAALLGRARLVVGRFGNGVFLSGHDEWVELYRDRRLDEPRRQLTIDYWLYPYPWNGHGWYVNKGEAGWGLIQRDERTLEFYLSGDEGARVQAPVPADWTLRWHRLTGVFDGGELRLYIDGAPAARKAYSGLTGDSVFPVNLGRRANMAGQEHDGYTSHVVLDAVRIWDRALGPEELITADRPAEALAWLDFEEEIESGTFFSLGIGARSYGLAWPDRRIQPELWQLKKSPQPVGIEAVDAAAGRIRITNRFQFTDLSELDGVWELQADGRVLESGEVALSLAPGRSQELRILFSRPRPEPGVEYRLLVSFRLPESTPWAPAGHEVAWEQLELPYRTPVNRPVARPAAMTDEGGQVVISGDGFSYRFDRSAGRLVSMAVQGRELLHSGPRFNLWRAPVANDFDPTWGEPKMAFEWLAAGLDRMEVEVSGVEVESGQGRIRVHSLVRSPLTDFRLRLVHVYDFHADGSVEISQEAVPEGNLPRWLPKLGMQLEVARELDRVQWFGRGPFETYPDRKTGAKVGVWTAQVEDLYAPYLIPQDYGNLTDVRWIVLSSDDGVGLMATGDRLLHAAARGHSTDNLTRAEYPFQLTASDGIVLDLDLAVTGVGCTAIKTLEPYRVMPEASSYRITLRPWQR